DAGVHTFNNVTLDTAGAQSITATDTVSPSITGSDSTTVTPAAASTLLLSGLPATTPAGAPQTLTVTAFDQFGNIASGYTGTVQFSSSDGLATLPPDYTFVPGDHGEHTFSATLNSGGSQTIH